MTTLLAHPLNVGPSPEEYCQILKGPVCPASVCLLSPAPLCRPYPPPLQSPAGLNPGQACLLCLFYELPSPSLAAIHLSVSFRGLGLSCTSCSQASALWQGRPVCEITPLSCSHYTWDTLYPTGHSSTECQWLLKKGGLLGAGWARRQLWGAFSGTVEQKMVPGPQLRKEFIF